MFIDPGLALFLTLIVGFGAIVSIYDMSQPNYPQYRVGCRECAVAKQQADLATKEAQEAQKRRQEQLQREWLEESRRLIRPGADAESKSRVLRRSDSWMVSAKEVVEEVRQQVSDDERGPDHDDGGRAA